MTQLVIVRGIRGSLPERNNELTRRFPRSVLAACRPAVTNSDGGPPGEAVKRSFSDDLPAAHSRMQHHEQAATAVFASLPAYLSESPPFGKIRMLRNRIHKAPRQGDTMIRARPIFASVGRLELSPPFPSTVSLDLALLRFNQRIPTASAAVLGPFSCQRRFRARQVCRPPGRCVAKRRFPRESPIPCGRAPRSANVPECPRKVKSRASMESITQRRA